MHPTPQSAARTLLRFSRRLQPVAHLALRVVPPPQPLAPPVTAWSACGGTGQRAQHGKFLGLTCVHLSHARLSSSLQVPHQVLSAGDLAGALHVQGE